MQGHWGSMGIWSGGRSRSKGRSSAIVFMGVSVGKVSQSWVNRFGLASLNNVRALNLLARQFDFVKFYFTFVRIDLV